MISFFENFTETLWTWILPSMFKVLVIIFIAFLAQNLISFGTKKIKDLQGNSDPDKQSKKLKRVKTLNQIIRSTTGIIINTIALIMILNELGLDTRPLIASAGILGVAFSLGAQNLMKDVINGFFILLEDQFGLGDTIKIGDHTGIVEKMNFRTVTLKDSSGNFHIIPNGEIKQVSVLKHI